MFRVSHKLLFTQKFLILRKKLLRKMWMMNLQKISLYGSVTQLFIQKNLSIFTFDLFSCTTLFLAHLDCNYFRSLTHSFFRSQFYGKDNTCTLNSFLELLQNEFNAQSIPLSSELILN